MEAALREVDVGEWSGLTTDEIEARYPEGAARRRSGGTGWEHGESIEAMSARIVAALVAIAAAHDGETVLVVTHGGPIREVRRAAGCERARDGISSATARSTRSPSGKVRSGG